MAFLQESQGSHQPALRVPGVVAWLLMALVVAHVARVYAPGKQPDEILLNFAFIPARYSPQFLIAHGIDPGSLLERIVQFFSYVFLHGDFGHLAINSLWLLACGPIVARRFGAVLFLLFFFICAVAAAAAHLAFNPESVAPVIGASGAVSGLMAVGIRLLNVPPGNPRLAPAFSSQVMGFTAVWLVVNVIAGVTGIGAGPGAQPIAWQAHIGGYFAGLILAGPFDVFRRRRS